VEGFLTSLKTVGFSRQSLDHGASGSRVHIFFHPLLSIWYAVVHYLFIWLFTA